uniref:Uncharacterized protein n=1 Tax=Trichogramma kaykai TaxID=54128 RepID=A0ABD2X4W3_9HYME
MLSTTMSKFATFYSIVVALNVIISLGSVLPASASYRSLPLKRDIGKNELVFDEGSFENDTIYYGVCNKPYERTERECTLHRLQANFWEGSPKEDECNILLRSESGGKILPSFAIDSLSKDRAIVRWCERVDDLWPAWKKFQLRFNIIDFSNYEVKTVKRSKDLDEMVASINWNKLRYLKKGDDYEVVLSDKTDIKRLSINAEGVASEVDTWFTRPTYLGHPTNMIPLSTDKGYLFIESIENMLKVAHIQANGQRQNLTHIEGVFSPKLVSSANGLIGVCARVNETMMKCTQFKLGDNEINWFTANILNYDQHRSIYNLPRGEGFLTHITYNIEDKEVLTSPDKYLVKISLDGKAKQFLDPDMNCQLELREFGYKKLSEDVRGNYCLTTACKNLIPG